MSQVTLVLTPPPIARVFYRPEVVVDAGNVRDIELAACRLFLGWQAHHPDYTPRLEIKNRPEEQAALQRALFRRRKN